MVLWVQLPTSAVQRGRSFDQRLQLQEIANGGLELLEDSRAGFVGIFVPTQKSSKTAASKAASYSQEELMPNLSRKFRGIH